MLKDITLGQYFPGETVIHKLDPRTKILVMLAYIAVTFCVKNFYGYIALGAFIVISVVLSKIPPSFVIKGLKPIMVFIFITA
ncbi:MAG: CbiQ family ECF transporter T component, partial [Clostridia bacterium]|nr:CbiQ family ECF transporter T component [Clostridia bacterium]